MQNLDQLRAAKADSMCQPQQGQNQPDFNRSDVASIPALILTNGLLAAAAFCCEEGKKPREGMKLAFNGIASHLQARGIAGQNVRTGQALITDLAGKDSHVLQRATAEALALLAYLKRFAKPKDKQPVPA